MLLNPLATRQQLEQTPSRSDGVTCDIELELRALGCQIIQQMGVLLRLPQRTMAVAQVFFQRFWYTSSMCDFSAKEIALGSLLLATKLEETQVRLRHLLNAYDYVLFRLTKGNRATHTNGQGPTATSETARPGFASGAYQPLGQHSAEFYSIRDAVVVSEMQILKRLGFHVEVMLPYALLVNYLQVLSLAGSDVVVTVKPHQDSVTRHPEPLGDSNSASRVRVTFAQCAWSFLNDALQTPVLCMFTPNVVACAAIALAADMCQPQICLPTTPAPWWLLFDASEPEIKIAASHLLWRYHHKSCLPNAAELLDRHELRKYIATLPASLQAEPKPPTKLGTA